MSQYSHTGSDGGGMHTMMIGKKLTYDESGELIADIKHSSLFRFDGPPVKTKTGLTYSCKPTNGDARGMELTIVRSKFLPEYLAMHPKDIIVADGRLEGGLTSLLLVKTAPKVLAGVPDYVASADSSCVDRFVEQFNDICRTVSPVMGSIDDYYLQRTDPAVNILLHDLRAVAIDAIRRNRVDVTPWHIVQLVRCGDIPRWFARGSYDKTTDDRSLYLKCKSTNVNIYCKGDEMRGWKNDCLARSDRVMDIFRIEVQLKHRKISSMMSNNRNWSDVRDLIFSEDWNLKIVTRYWHRVVGWGDWYKYQEAVKIIQREGYRSNREKRLIGVLDLIRMCGSVALAKQRLSGRDRVVFVNGLAELRKSEINGVCIPDEWGIEWIPNILEKWLMENDHSDLIVWDDG